MKNQITTREQKLLTKRNQLLKAMEEVGDTFSTIELFRIMRNNGCPKAWLENNRMMPFLKEVSNQVSKKCWQKIPSEVADENFEMECIDYLKQKGYKIMKPVQEYVEL